MGASRQTLTPGRPCRYVYNDPDRLEKAIQAADKAGDAAAQYKEELGARAQAWARLALLLPPRGGHRNTAG